MKPRVLVTLKIPSEDLAPLDGIAEIEMSPHEWDVMPRAEILAKIGDCDALLSQGELRVDDELLEAAPKLRIAANAAMGIDNLDLEALNRRGVWATNTPSAFVESTADLTLGLILSTVRRIAEGDRFVRRGEWEKTGMQPVRWEGMLLGGRTLGMVGYGKIAQAVERRARAFDMKVIHCRTQPSEHPDCRSFEELLTESDIVGLFVPHTLETHRLMNAATLAQMKPGAVLINVARGKVVDEPALVAALESGHLGGAGLDVFEAEPKVNPALYELKNVTLTPHLGGSTRADRQRGRLEAAENVARVLRGELPLTPVNRPGSIGA
ncbi:MAG: D-glycerate dehydrogenase [Verrucomicrobiae bacterium]|nr:D-glycerate dehydrogenase [Verrucomicrobiae bacterium]